MEEYFALARQTSGPLLVTREDWRRRAEEHADLLEAIRKRDLRAALAAVRRHRARWAPPALEEGQGGDDSGE